MKFPSSFRILIGGALLAGAAPAFAQAPAQQTTLQPGQTPVYKVNVVEYVQRSTRPSTISTAAVQPKLISKARP